MIHKILKLSLVILLSSVTLSCSGLGSGFDEQRAEAYKSFPSRGDDWFVNPKDKIDPYGNLSRADYKNLTDYSNDGFNKSMSGPVGPKIQMPDVTNLLSSPEEQKLQNDKLVSISINENIPLKDVLIELARRAEVDVEIGSDVDGRITFVAKDKPFSQVVERIANMAGLRYSFNNGVLKIEKDKPKLVNYKFNILDISRSSSSSVNTSFTVGGSSSGSSGSSSSGSSGSSSSGGSTGGSTSTLSTKSGDGDIWQNIDTSVTKILSSSSSPAASGSTAESTYVTINKNAGIVSVFANDAKQKEVKEYLDRMHIELTSQALIEARVVEVTLSDEYSSGINWAMITDSGQTGGALLNASFAGPTINKTLLGSSDNTFKFSLMPDNIFGNGNTLQAATSLLQTFGTTRSLSNPRVSALNNQFAVLNFSKNEVYFDIQEDSTTTTSSGGSSTSGGVKPEIKTVPVGIVLTLQPSIDLGRNEILMNVKPTLTKIKERVENVGARIIAEKNEVTGIDTKIPVVETREMDTMLRIKNGEIMVIGGLLEQTSENTDTGLPGLSNIPYLGNAFKGVTKIATNVETVIFIKATIVPGQGVSIEDEEFYKKFTTPRGNFVPN